MSCYGCKNTSVDICPESSKDCGHHSNAFWIFGFCDWCDAENVNDEDFKKETK